MKNTKWLVALFLSALFVLAGCGNEEAEMKTDKATETNTEKTAIVQELPYTVTDDLGKEITFDQVPEKVISLQPSNTEILFALDAGDKVIGATEFDNYPAEAAKIERVSDSMTINAEKIIALKPDVVIAYTIGDMNTLKPLEDAGIKIFVIESAESFEEVYSDIDQLATVMNVKEKGNQLIKSIKKKIADVSDKVAKVNKTAIYFEISPSPELYTAGSGTFQNEILEKAGIGNIFEDQEGWPTVSEEEIIKRNPAVITTTVGYTDDPIGEIKSRKGWGDIKAVAEGQVYKLDENIMSRPGPRIGDAVELAAKTIYPDLFN